MRGHRDTPSGILQIVSEVGHERRVRAYNGVQDGQNRGGRWSSSDMEIVELVDLRHSARYEKRKHSAVYGSHPGYNDILEIGFLVIHVNNTYNEDRRKNNPNVKLVNENIKTGYRLSFCRKLVLLDIDVLRHSQAEKAKELTFHITHVHTLCSRCALPHTGW